MGQREYLDQDYIVCKEGDDLIAIYVPTRNLSVYQSGVTSGGTVVAFEVIPSLLTHLIGFWSILIGVNSPSVFPRFTLSPSHVFRHLVGVGFLGFLVIHIDDELPVDISSQWHAVQ